MPRGKVGENNSNKNYYAITNGRVNGIFKSWSQAKPLVDKFSGAAFKGFEHIDKAMDFMKKGGFSDLDIHIFETDSELPQFTEERQEQNEFSAPAEDNTEPKDDIETNNEVNANEETKEMTVINVCEDENSVKRPICVICKMEENREMLQCSTCNGRVHHACTGLPAYQIAVFKNTQRKFMCEFCVVNSTGIKIKTLRKSVSEVSISDDNQGSTFVQNITIANVSNQVHAQGEDLAEIKQDVSQIKLTLASFEQEMTKIVLHMRDENTALREQMCENKLKEMENEREVSTKHADKLENTNEELNVQIANLKEKISRIQSERDNLQKCITSRSETQTKLETELKEKSLEIQKLRTQINFSSCQREVLPVSQKEELNTTQNQSDSNQYTLETNNRFTPLTHAQIAGNRQDDATYVKGYTDPLSTFYNCKFNCNRKKFHSLEQAFQHEKAIYHGDVDTAKRILNSKHAGIANKVGRNIKLHPDWDKDKDDIMYEMIQSKYQQCHQFRLTLHQTGSTTIVHDIPDRYWAMGTDGRGRNKLGVFLEDIRKNNTSEEEPTDKPRKPVVAIFGSSLIKNMDARRFSNRYQTDIQMSYTITEAKRNVTEYKRQADVIMYQLLSNDIKQKSTTDCVTELKDLILHTRSVQDRAKIVISLPTNRGDERDLNNKTNIVNASVKVEFQNYDHVYISDNSNLSYRGEPNRKMISVIDGVHPTEFGEKVLFLNIRRAVDDVCK